MRFFEAKRQFQGFTRKIPSHALRGAAVCRIFAIFRAGPCRNLSIVSVNPGRWDTHSPLSYRQPLLFMVWHALGSGAAITMAWSVLAVLLLHSLLGSFRCFRMCCTDSKSPQEDGGLICWSGV